MRGCVTFFTLFSHNISLHRFILGIKRVTTHKKLPPMQCCDLFSNSRVIYRSKNHHVPYCPQCFGSRTRTPTPQTMKTTAFGTTLLMTLWVKSHKPSNFRHYMSLTFGEAFVVVGSVWILKQYLE